MKKLLFFIAILSICATAFAECPDFTNLTSSHITAYTGNTPRYGTPFDVVGVVPGRHTLITAPGTDPRTGNMLSVLPPLGTPGGGGPVIKLGNENIRYEAEALVYRYTVDAANAILLLNFAVVLQDPGHPHIAQPRFVVRVANPTTITPANPQGDLVEECAEYDVSSAAEIPGFQSFGINRWRDWTVMAINLTEFVGQEVEVQFITYDCDYGAHYGYCYFTASCMSSSLEVGNCNLGTFTLEAPDNFNTYLWSNGATTRTATFTTAEVNNSQITCKVTSDMGCEVTFYAYASTNPDAVMVTDVSDIICEGESYTISNVTITPKGIGQFFYPISIVDISGCTTEIIHLTLTVAERYTRIKSSICFEDEFTDYGLWNKIPQWPTPGIWRDTVKTGTVGSCDVYNVLELKVNVSFASVTPITGDTSPCTEELATYTCSGAELLDWIEWKLPANAVLVKGNLYRSSQITVYFKIEDATPGSIIMEGGNGCGSGSSSLTVTPRQSFIFDFDREVCQGEEISEFEFINGNQNTAGYFIHTKTYHSSQGCDSTINVYLTVLPKPEVRIAPKDTALCNPGDEITLAALLEDNLFVDPPQCTDLDAYGPVFIYNCGFTYLWNTGATAQFITENPIITTLYEVTVTTSGGCSASAKEWVVVDPGVQVVVYDTICNGEIYSIYGITATTSGTYPTTIVEAGCVIDFILELKVNEPTQLVVSGNICAGKTFTAYGMSVDIPLYYEGLYRDTVAYFVNSAGCDSLVIFNLNVLPRKTTVVRDTVCQFSTYSGYGFTLSKQNISGLQTYTNNTLTTTQGCDSVVTLKLFVKPVIITNFGVDVSCAGTAIFTNWSLVYDETVIENWNWYLDGSVTHFAITKDATIAALTRVPHTVTLQAILKDGCVSEITKDIGVFDCICPTVTYDCHGNEYKVSKVGGLCWTDNIRATHYSLAEFDVIPDEFCGDEISYAKPYYSLEYPDMATNENIFGLLYTWYSAVNLPEGSLATPPLVNGFVQGVCPAGFHVPSRAEWDLLNPFPTEELKSAAYWLTPGTDLYEFEARPAGWYSGAAGKFIDLYGATFWWAVEDTTGSYADTFYITYFCSEPQDGKNLKIDGLSVRCIMDY